MSTVLIEKIKQKTIDEILPVWSQYLKNIDYSPFAMGISSQRYKFEEENKVEYKNTARCMMGEFHGWSEGYGIDGNPEFCQECRDISMGGDRNNPPSIIRRIMTPQGRNSLIRDIENHYNEVHARR